MKVLFICSKPPYPKIDGGCIASADMLHTYLNHDWAVDVLTMSTHKHPFSISKFPKEVTEDATITNVKIDTKVKPLDALMYLFKDGSYNIARFEDDRVAKVFKKMLKQKEYDIVHFEGLYTLPYIQLAKNLSDAFNIYRAHNIEYTIWDLKSRETKNLFKSGYLKKLKSDLKKFELKVVPNADVVIAITKDDANILQNITNNPVHTYPTTINATGYEPKPWPKKISIFHIGAMDWEPNINGIQWFLDKVWRKFSQKHPHISLHLAGKAMPKDFGTEYKSLKNYGQVKDAMKFINSHQVMIVPLFSGSGLKIKVIEALALGRLVIGTPKAFEGIDVEDKKNVLIAKTVSQFNKQLNWIIAHREEAEEIAKQGRSTIVRDYDPATNTQAFFAFLNQQMKQ